MKKPSTTGLNIFIVLFGHSLLYLIFDILDVLKNIEKEVLMMSKKVKYSIGQMITLLIAILLFFFIDRYLTEHGVTTGPSSMYIVAGLLYIYLGWLYITLFLQFKKYPNWLEHAIWNRMPLLLFIVALISFVAIMIGPVFDWLAETWNGFLYVLLMYFFTLFFLFLMTMVHKMSTNKENVIHSTFAIAAIVLLIGMFILN